MKVAFLTLGCKVNFYETEKMIEQFQRNGFSVVGFSERADIYVINTCTVTNMADRKSRQMIHRAKKKNPDSIVVAVGCYVESGGEKLLEDASLDAAFSNREKETVVERIIQQFHLSENRQENLPEGGISQGDSGKDYERTRAYLKIQDGCNQFCTYCAIPYVRGGGVLSSTPADEVVERVRELAEKGYKEVVLTGIHVSSYGVDFSGEKNFVKLQGRPLADVMEQISHVKGVERIRMSSLEPRIITRSFLEEISTIPKICPHFHLSLQSGCDTVLKRMNRHYDTGEYKEKLDMIREYYRDPAITTDIIVGFPGETNEEFEVTREFLRMIQLADIHVFKYSERTGTRAAQMPDPVSPEIKNVRSEQLIEDTKKYRKEYCERFLGTKQNVLFEETVVEKGETYLTGHNERYVKIGVPIEKAMENGYKQNEIREVLVENILSK